MLWGMAGKPTIQDRLEKKSVHDANFIMFCSGMFQSVPVAGFRALCLLDVVIVVDRVAAVVVVAVLHLQVVEEALVAVVAVAGLEKQGFIKDLIKDSMPIFHSIKGCELH